MPSESHIKYIDVISGEKVTNPDSLPQTSPGYDSYFTEIPVPPVFINESSRGIARYIGALPIDFEPLTLGEGSTPLIPSNVYPNVYIKNEGMNPTGNFKDRESAVTLAYAKEKGYKKVAIASSGNAALSSALYAQIHGIDIICYVPEKTPEHKLKMIDLFGGRTQIVGKTYEEAYHYLLNNLPEGTVNITSGVFTLRSEGNKTIAYEIWEDLGSVPDVIVCPAGNGSALAAIYHGFADLKNWGLISKVPKMICVQIEGADPINQALRRNEWITKLTDITDSQCEAIVAQESYCSPKAVYAVKESGGFGISVTDDDVINGLRYAISKEGVFPEFSSASVYGAFLKYSDKIMEAGEKIVLINTATGLKELHALSEILAVNQK